MAAPPIPSVRKRPYRFFTLDVGSMLLAASLVCHWQVHPAAAFLCGLAGVVTGAIGGYQAMRQTRLRPTTVPVTAPDATAESRISGPQRP